MYEQYSDRIAFYVVYIQEAHPSDAWQMPVNERENVVFADPRSTGERAEVAGLCVRRLAIKIPALLDAQNNSTEKAYTGWPDRLYLIDRQGKVVWKSAAGPYGFHPSELETQIKKILPEQHS